MRRSRHLLGAAQQVGRSHGEHLCRGVVAVGGQPLRPVGQPDPRPQHAVDADVGAERRVAACALSAGAGSQNGFPFCMRWIARAVGKLLAMVGMGLEILSADVPERGNT